MKRIMLIGPSQCGKTSLTQSLNGEAVLQIFARRIDDHVIIVDVLGLMVCNGFSLHRLRQCRLAGLAPSHENYLSHNAYLLLISQTA